MSTSRSIRLLDATPRAAFFVCLLGFVNATMAQDLVLLAPADGNSASIQTAGEVLDYTGRELRLRLSTGKERTFPAERVKSVSTKLSAEQSAADALFAKRDFEQALKQYRRALQAGGERREWVRRQILSQIVWCEQSLGHNEQSAYSFLLLLASDPTTQYFDCIPLAWFATGSEGAWEQKAKTWLVRDSVRAGQLIAASYLLAGADRAAAIDCLRRLTDIEDPRIATLAEAQLWRTDSFNADKAQLDRRQRAIEKMPESLRAGPYFVIGTALCGRGPEDAALALLRVPILYPRERPLAAAALLKAAECLAKKGQQPQASALCRELIERFDDTPESAEALDRLRQVEEGR